MEIITITNDKEHDSARRWLESMIEANPEPDKKKAAEMRTLALIIEDYEKRRWPMPKVEPVELIKFIMDRRGLTVKDIAPCFGTTSRTYEVLNGKRNLSLNMIRHLRAKYQIPAECLI